MRVQEEMVSSGQLLCSQGWAISWEECRKVASGKQKVTATTHNI